MLDAKENWMIDLPVAEACTFALSLQKEKYGSGQGDGRFPRGYHNTEHVQAAIAAATNLGLKAVADGKITKREADLVVVAVAFHDVEQEKGSGKNEDESAKIAVEWMKQQANFTQEDRDEVTRLIEVTKVFNDENNFMHQRGENGDLAERIVADADLIVIGCDWEFFEKMSIGLWTEFGGKKLAGFSDPDEETLKLLKFQFNFLNGRHFWCEYTNALYPNLKSNFDRLKSLIYLD